MHYVIFMRGKSRLLHGCLLHAIRLSVYVCEKGVCMCECVIKVCVCVSVCVCSHGGDVCVCSHGRCVCM